MSCENCKSEPCKSEEKKTLDMIECLLYGLMVNAHNNWCDSHIEMLKRLIVSTLTGKPYDQITLEEIDDIIQEVKE